MEEENQELENLRKKYHRLKILQTAWWLFMLIFGLAVLYVFFNLPKFVDCNCPFHQVIPATWRNWTVEEILNISLR